jgi:hypothetical protein
MLLDFAVEGCSTELLLCLAAKQPTVVCLVQNAPLIALGHPDRLARLALPGALHNANAMAPLRAENATDVNNVPRGF